jgi:hypothetical protein
LERGIHIYGEKFVAWIKLEVECCMEVGSKVFRGRLREGFERISI